MSDDENKTEQASTGESTGDRTMGFDCCGTRMGDVMAGCPCGSIMRRHRVFASATLAVMGMAALAIPAGIILGIIAFFRTI